MSTLEDQVRDELHSCAVPPAPEGLLKRAADQGRRRSRARQITVVSGVLAAATTAAVLGLLFGQLPGSRTSVPVQPAGLPATTITEFYLAGSSDRTTISTPITVDGQELNLTIEQSKALVAETGATLEACPDQPYLLGSELIVGPTQGVKIPAAAQASMATCPGDPWVARATGRWVLYGLLPAGAQLTTVQAGDARVDETVYIDVPQSASFPEMMRGERLFVVVLDAPSVRGDDVVPNRMHLVKRVRAVSATGVTLEVPLSPEPEASHAATPSTPN